jgi:hypothetical protein
MKNINFALISAAFIAVILRANVTAAMPIDDKTNSGLSARPSASYTYTSSGGQTYTLYPWVGTHVALLTKSNDLDAPAMQRILRAIDSAYVYYSRLTGRIPKPYSPGNNQVGAIVNFLRAAKAATGKDYRNLMRDETLQEP